MTQDCAFDVRHLGLGRNPASPARDRAFAMPITGLGLTLVRPDAKGAVYKVPEHFHGVAGMPAGVGQPSGWHEVNRGGYNLTPEPRGSEGPHGNMGAGGTSSGSATNVGGEGGGRLGPAAGSSGEAAELLAGGEELFPHGTHYNPPSHFQGINGLPTGVGAFADGAADIVGVGRKPTGLGQVTLTNPFACPAGSGWKGLSSTSALFLQVAPALSSRLAVGGVSTASDGWIYFTYGGSHFRYNPTLTNGPIQQCTVGAVTVVQTAPVVAGALTPVALVYSASGIPSVHQAVLSAQFLAMVLPPTAPQPGIPVFQTAAGLGQFAWVYNSTGVARPTAPPPGVSLPGAWCMVRPHFWQWYPMPAYSLAIVNTYYVVSNVNQLLGIGGPTLPRPTQVPAQLAAAGITGQWINTGPAYWVFIPYAAATTSYAWLWALLLVGGAGVGAYYLLD
jgi:hypothetical protein